MALNLRELFRHLTYQVFSPGTLLRDKYNAFQRLLDHDNACLDLIAELEQIHGREILADWARVDDCCRKLGKRVHDIVTELGAMNPTRYLDLEDYYRKINFYVQRGVHLHTPRVTPPYVLTLLEAEQHPDLAGGKATHLSQALKITNLHIPPGFVVTASGYHYFMEACELRPRVDALLAAMDPSDTQGMAALTREIQDLILAAELPLHIADEIEAALIQLGEDGLFSVRSSAVGEDSHLTFAGLYTSELDVARDDVHNAFKKVLAGKYNHEAVSYRILHGLTDLETPMAVLIQPMVKARASGVVYTCDPGHGPDDESVLAVYVASGPGATLVGGCVDPGIALFSKTTPPGLMEFSGQRPGGVGDDGLTRLAEHALKLERFFDHPQDMEWALDHDGGWHLLQTRPLKTGGVLQSPTSLPPLAEDVRILATGSQCVTQGSACGPAYHVSAPGDMKDIPGGAVVVTRTLTPALVRGIDAMSAVIAEVGSRASHFASVAREFNLPVLSGATGAMEAIAPGQVVTVDTSRCQVYEGQPETGTEPPGPALVENRTVVRLDKIMPLVSRLTLKDPESAEFRPDKVKSLHDIVRFCHEKAVAEMFSLVDKGGRGMARAKKLKSELPLSMYVLDLGGGLFDEAANEKEVTPQMLRSSPMWSFWFGLSDPDVPWDQAMPHMDWEEFDRVSAGLFKVEGPLLSSYAVLSGEYMHLMLRFGYHFSVVDTLCGDEPKNNYINFRFKGGGGNPRQRELRLEYISRILQHYGFEVTAKGDLLDAAYLREENPQTQKRLAVLGYLAARTRLMDMGLEDHAQARSMADEFITRKSDDRY